VTKCATVAGPVNCFFSSVGAAQTNIAALAKGLRSAAGASIPIIGLTYPDVLLGLWVYPAANPDKGLAALWVSAFRDDFNPALKTAYASARAKFVDITAATGAYTPLTQTTTLSPYGEIPVAVAQACRLTWYCELGEHPREYRGLYRHWPANRGGVRQASLSVPSNVVALPEPGRSRDSSPRAHQPGW
jgi:hypothetical protein